MGKEIYLIRHAERDDKGTITDIGRQAATKLKEKLPQFLYVISSESERTQKTAFLITGEKPKVDARAGFYTASPEKSDALNKISKEKNISFLQAVVLLNDLEVLKGVHDKADQLNDLIQELFISMPEGAKAIVVSHDLSISPAMEKRGVPLESIPFLGGYIIGEDGVVSTFKL